MQSICTIITFLYVSKKTIENIYNNAFKITAKHEVHKAKLNKDV